jgi:hypothetical protein
LLFCPQIASPDLPFPHFPNNTNNEYHPNCYQLVDKDTPEEKEHNRKIFERSREIGEAEWAELWEILKGQDYEKFENDEEKSWNSQFDGSGLRGWWD